MSTVVTFDDVLTLDAILDSISEYDVDTDWEVYRSDFGARRCCIVSTHKNKVLLDESDDDDSTCTVDDLLEMQSDDYDYDVLRIEFGGLTECTAIEINTAKKYICIG